MFQAPRSVPDSDVRYKILLLEGNVKIEDSVTVFYFPNRQIDYSKGSPHSAIPPQNGIFPLFQQKSFRYSYSSSEFTRATGR